MPWFGRGVVLGFSLTILFFLFAGRTEVRAVSSSVDFSFTIESSSPSPTTGNLRLTGYASPGALVTFSGSNAVIGNTTADSSSYFDKTLSGLSPGVQVFSLYGSDVRGRTTLTLSVDVNIIAGSTVTLSGFLLPPTISIEKPELKRPDWQKSNGYAKNGSPVTSFFNSDPISKKVDTDSSGYWEAKVTDIFHLGSHSANALVQDRDGNQSSLTPNQAFSVVISADLNVDARVNLTDFSILMYSYGTSPPPNLAADINDSGGGPNLVDFSIMMYHWTR